MRVGETRLLGGSLRPRVIVAHGLCDLGQVALAPARQQRRRRMQLDRSCLPLEPARGEPGKAERREPRLQSPRESFHPGIIPGPCHGREDRNLIVPQARLAAIAPPLLAHVAQRVGRPLAIAFVEHDQVGEIEHVDLLELRRRAVVGRHDVERAVDPIDDLRIALADACGLEQHEVEARRSAAP